MNPKKDGGVTVTITSLLLLPCVACTCIHMTGRSEEILFLTTPLLRIWGGKGDSHLFSGHFPTVVCGGAHDLVSHPTQCQGVTPGAITTHPPPPPQGRGWIVGQSAAVGQSRCQDFSDRRQIPMLTMTRPLIFTFAFLV